jgi:hypothetical protein
MSAQGGTLHRRGTVVLPIWPVAVLVVALLATVIGMTMLGDAARTKFVTSVTNTERLENSSASFREQGAVAAKVDLTNSGVAIQHRGYAIAEWGSTGGPNEALHRQFSAPQEGVAPALPHGPIMVNGTACMQCR